MSCPGLSLPSGKTRYPLYRRLGGTQGWSWQVRNISPPPGFDPRTVQPVASRYTEWATGPVKLGAIKVNKILLCLKQINVLLSFDWEKLLYSFYVLLTVHLGIILVNNRLDAKSFSVYVYFGNLHVTGNHVHIIRRINCINTTSGKCHST